MIARSQQIISEIAADVASGLSRTPKSLPPRLFYDARGSELFDAITELPEYYPTRTERGILTANAAEIATLVPRNAHVVELGAGTATKTGIVLRALSARQLRVEYYPVDVSRTALAQARESLHGDAIRVRPIVADYHADESFLAAIPSPKLVMYIGSSIGNFEPDEAADLLYRVRLHLAPGDALLLGVDLVKTESVLVPAYDDAQGVTAEFNKNILARINRELAANFDLAQFRHVALWNERQSRIEMHIESVVGQQVQIRGLGMTVGFAAGERLHTENSYKYTPARLDELLRNGGFEVQRRWTDTREWFAVQLAYAT